uniref:Uncharacterized protein n=1 Tax=Arundo donax TaxID=35708 RepID=A0A0A9BEW3_ARUDO
MKIVAKPPHRLHQDSMQAYYVRLGFQLPLGESYILVPSASTTSSKSSTPTYSICSL